MQFNSLSFCVFLPVVFMIYWLLHRWHKWQNLFLLAASYLFYGWWDWRFLSLIAFTSLSSFITGLQIENANNNGNHKKARIFLLVNLIVNLGVLAVFKYYGFFIDNLREIGSLMGFTLDWPTLNILLPVGISFYTFQALSYSIDVYRGNLRATRNGVAFFTFISFFPQLVAGPIERASHLLPQMLNRRKFCYPQFVDGCRQMLAGFLKKVVIADTCALAVDRVWIDVEHKSGLILVVGAILFAIQIYCDFSGYSDIAIGSAKLFGIKLNKNFNLPFQSQSYAELWRRWHISLMTWFRDYVYIPLGGSRRGKAVTIRNTWIVFLTSGLWHGANWTYVVWGAYHALLLMLGILRGRRHTVISRQKLWPGSSALLKMMLMFSLFAFGFIIFRAPSIGDAYDYVVRMFSPQAWILGMSLPLGKKALFYSLALLLFEWFQRNRDHLLDFPRIAPFDRRWVRWAIYYACVLAILLLQDNQGAFIYFQF